MILYTRLKWAMIAWVALCLLALAADSGAQYIGSGRPWPAVRSVADSVRLDSVQAAVFMDTIPPDDIDGKGIWEWGIAGDTTSPGLFYYRSGANTWSLVDTSVNTRAAALAMDSVPSGELCRFLRSGKFRRDAKWNWNPGDFLYSDSTTAGEIGTGGQAAPKKMQRYGTAVTADIIEVGIVQWLAY